jgi:hypothetical protein
MSTSDAFNAAFKEFISEHVLGPLADTSVANRDDSAEELVSKYRVTLDIPITTQTGSQKSKKKKSPVPKEDQKWIPYDDYTKSCDTSFLCGYVQTRGKFKDHYCGIELVNTNTVSWTKKEGFQDTTPENELSSVDGIRSDMRCKICWSRDPRTGDYKRKKGRGEKLISEHKGDVVAPTVISGVSVPDNTGLMGFLSGNTTTIQSPSRAMTTTKKVIMAKRFPGLERNENFSHVVPNPSHHNNMPWLIRADNDGQVVIGKFEGPISPRREFDINYLSDIIPLTEEDLSICKEYNLEYVAQDMSDIPVVQEREPDTVTMQDNDINVPILDIDELLEN